MASLPLNTEVADLMSSLLRPGGQRIEQAIDLGDDILYPTSGVQVGPQIIQGGQAISVESRLLALEEEYIPRAPQHSEKGIPPVFLTLPNQTAGGRARIGFGIRPGQRCYLALIEADLADTILLHKYIQYLFFWQWKELKDYANERGIHIIGDMPIFVSLDSADVWTNPDLFHLDATGQPTVVAGAPPDLFRPTGQLWGNPLYRWDRMAATGFRWWIERIRSMLQLADLIRLDHFRGFEAYWQVDASEKTALNGRWVAGPGAQLFAAFQEAFGTLPIIAEDLGVITPAVDALREQFDFPSMKVLQWAFTGDSHHPFLPHNYRPHCVVYTGTHDYDTTLGWFNTLSASRREFVLGYLGSDGSDLVWDLIRLALASLAEIALIPLQDVLRLGSEARLNLPGSAHGNWRWRYRATDLNPRLADELRLLTAIYGRTAESAGVS